MIDFVNASNLGEYAKEFGFSKLVKVKEIRSLEGKDDDSIRKALENKDTDLVYGVEKFRAKDKMNQKDSGLNHVLCKLANKNKIKIGFSFSDVLNSEGSKRSKILGRMIQNVELCNKYKVDMVVGSFAKNEYELRNSSDLIAFGRVLGMRKIWNEKIDNFYKDEDIGIRKVK